MITGIDLSETMDYTSSIDTGETKTVFKISPVSSRVQARIGKLAGSEGNGALDAMMEAFRFGVKGIVNLQDKHKIPIQFKTEETYVNNEKFIIVAKEIFDILPLSVVSEVGAKVIGFSNLSETETKN
jgi:hypothetical protein